MDGFKNTTKMKYMCGGPVRKATGGMIKSAAPKSVAKSAAAGKQLPTPEIAPKPLVNRPAPKDTGREIPRPTMEPKRQVQPTPPKSVAKPSDLGSKRFIDQTRPEPVREAPRPTMEPKRPTKPTPPELIREAPRPTMEPKRLIAQTPPDDVKTMGNAVQKAQTMAAASRDAKTVGGAPKNAKTMGGAPKDAKTMGSIIPSAKKGVPVASKKPMIGLKTGGYVSKSSFKW